MLIEGISTDISIGPTNVFRQLGGTDGIFELPPNTSVTRVETKGGWVLIIRDGRQLGYVAETSLQAVQYQGIGRRRGAPHVPRTDFCLLSLEPRTLHRGL